MSDMLQREGVSFLVKSRLKDKGYPPVPSNVAVGSSRTKCEVFYNGKIIELNWEIFKCRV